jgi:pimeloyl-ACP methyl ester carboxylesterase
MTETSCTADTDAGPIVGHVSGAGPAVGQGEQAAALLPGFEVVIVPAAGHLRWHEQPGCVASALSRIRGLAGDLEPAG